MGEEARAQVNAQGAWRTAGSVECLILRCGFPSFKIVHIIYWVICFGCYCAIKLLEVLLCYLWNRVRVTRQYLNNYQTKQCIQCKVTIHNSVREREMAIPLDN